MEDIWIFVILETRIFITKLKNYIFSKIYLANYQPTLEFLTL